MVQKIINFVYLVSKEVGMSLIIEYLTKLLSDRK